MSPPVLPPNANGLMIAEVTFYGTKMIYQSVEGNEVMQSLIVSSEWWGHNRVSFASLLARALSSSASREFFSDLKSIRTVQGKLEKKLDL